MNDYSRLTILFCLPRTRSQWWTWFFGRALEHRSLHDEMAHHASPAMFVRDVKELLKCTTGRIFIADTGAVFFHDYIVKHLPGVQCIYAFRNPQDVIASLRKQTGHNMTAMIEVQNKRLYTIAYGDQSAIRLHWGCVTIDMLRSLWTYVTGMPVPDDETLRLFDAQIIDKPLSEHFTDREKSTSLWGYRES